MKELNFHRKITSFNNYFEKIVDKNFNIDLYYELNDFITTFDVNFRLTFK